MNTKWKPNRDTLIWLLAGLVLVVGLIFYFLLFLAAIPLFPPDTCAGARTIAKSSLPLELDWTFSAEECFRNHPFIYDGHVIGRTDKRSVIVNAENGAPEFDFERGGADSFAGMPTFENLVAFTSEGGKQVNVLDLNSMELLWSKRVEGPLGIGIVGLEVDDEGVYVTTGEQPSRVLALEPASGNLLWQYSPINGRRADGMVLLSDVLEVFDGSSSFTLDKRSGVRLSDLKNLWFGGGTEILGNTVYGFHTDKLTAQDPETGETLWEFQKRPSGIAVVNRNLLLASQSTQFPDRPPMLYNLDAATGNLQWELELKENPVSDPVAIGETGYILLDDASILAFDVDSGDFIGTIETEPRKVRNQLGASGLSTDGTRLIAAFGDRQVFSFSPR